MSDFTEAQWAKAGRAARARSNAVRRPVRRAVLKATERGLVSIEFASQKASELAKSAGLSWAAFHGLDPSSRHGYTADDVRAIIAEG